MAKDSIRNKVSDLARSSTSGGGNKIPSPPPASATSPGDKAPILRQSDEAIATVLARELYTRERHYFLMRVIYSLCVVCCISLMMNIMQFMQPVRMRYFATDSNGAIKEMIAMDKPIQPLSAISTWVANSVVRAYTFSFANYRQEMSQAQENFTPEGWKGFEKALQDSGNLKAVIDNKYVATAVPTGAPVLLAQGIVEGRYAWKFQVPIIVTYQSLNQKITNPYLITAVVIRQSETENPRGLGIASLIAE